MSQSRQCNAWTYHHKRRCRARVIQGFDVCVIHLGPQALRARPLQALTLYIQGKSQREIGVIMEISTIRVLQLIHRGFCNEVGFYASLDRIKVLQAAYRLGQKISFIQD